MLLTNTTIFTHPMNNKLAEETRSIRNWSNEKQVMRDVNKSIKHHQLGTEKSVTKRQQKKRQTSEELQDTKKMKRKTIVEQTDIHRKYRERHSN